MTTETTTAPTPLTSDEKQRDQLRIAYVSVLGGVIAISPELYGQAMTRIAAMVGRVDDESFRSDVRAMQATLPCYID